MKSEAQDAHRDVHSVRPGFVTLWELVILSSVLGVEVPSAGIPAAYVSEYHHPQRVESKNILYSNMKIIIFFYEM
jgi:hypothetical protein